MTIHQVIARSLHGDSITNDALGLQAQIMHASGAPSAIWCIDLDDDLIGVDMRRLDPSAHIQIQNRSVDGDKKDYRDGRNEREGNGDVWIVHVREPDELVIDWMLQQSNQIILRPHGWWPTTIESILDPKRAAHLKSQMLRLTQVSEKALACLPVSLAAFRALGLNEAMPFHVVAPLFPSDGFTALSQDPQHISAGSKRQTHPDVLCVGRLTAHAGLHDLVVAFHLAACKYAQNATLRLIGRFSSDTYRDAISELASDLRVRISFEDFISQEALMQHMSTAAVLVAPSFASGFGVRTVEAMSAGVPVVARSAGGLFETVGDGGLLVNATDKPDVLAEAIGAVLVDAPLRARLRSAGRSRSQLFAPQVSAGHFVTAMHELAVW